MPTIGSLNVAIRANTKAFRKGIKKARWRLRQFKRSIPGANLLLSKFGAALTVGGFGYFVNRSMQAIDATTKFADRIGITVEGLQSLQHAAELTGVGMSALQQGLQRMVRRTAEAAKGTGEAVKAFKELKLDASELVKLPVDVMFQRIADAMMKVETQADRVRLTMKLADSEGVALVNTLALGAEGLQGINEELAKAGLLWNRFDAKQVEDANDAFANLKLTIKKVGEAIGVGLAPWIKLVTTRLNEWIIGKGNIGGRVRELIKSVSLGIAGLADNVVDGMQDLATGLARLKYLNLKALDALPGLSFNVRKAYWEWQQLRKAPTSGIQNALKEQFQQLALARERAGGQERGARSQGRFGTQDTQLTRGVAGWTYDQVRRYESRQLQDALRVTIAEDIQETNAILGRMEQKQERAGFLPATAQ